MSELVANFSLPVPPSANALYKRVLNARGKRPRTEAYDAWLREAGHMLAISPRRRALEPYKRVHIELRMPIGYRRDIDNSVKPVLDLLTAHGVIFDDRWVEELRVRRVPATEPLTVSIWRIADAIESPAA